ncbi:hypothetical protein Pan181_46980 [Aeoliella mucimassa]|uniref:Uncharacterized protein n=2 Tax=Aeoliella mucimassa TaxID=2527972 RepID=A0A518AUS1_9BACT|nr:hypothetical protein Pan181_46980 [Aeoliella mucimassa]
MPEPELAALRQAIAESRLVNRAGDLVTREPAAALVCRTASLAYLVLDGIPVLVPDEAIALTQLGSPSTEEHDAAETAD